LTCGQTFCWHRTEGQLYEDTGSEYYTFRNGEPILVSKTGDGIEVKTVHDREEVKRALGLHHDLDEIFSSFPDSDKLSRARDEFWGLRIIQDDFFPCLISYLLSPQMQIPVIKRRFNEIAEEYGETVEFDGRELLRFPNAEELSEASEEDLRDIGVGYRATYVVETLDRLENVDVERLPDMEYTEAREELKKLYGVGNKVADCILLFSLGFTEACPLDTWAWRAVEQHFPELHSDDYDETVEKLHGEFGDHAGYALEYFFHSARNGVFEVEQ
jgi:N-glycosylase/DNA lyase